MIWLKHTFTHKRIESSPAASDDLAGEPFKVNFHTIASALGWPIVGGLDAHIEDWTLDINCNETIGQIYEMCERIRETVNRAVKRRLTGRSSITRKPNIRVLYLYML